jgi:hypothetical protein
MSERSLFLRTWWIPPGLWALTLFSIRGYDGWGAWAAAPLLLPALLLSLAGALWGLWLLAVAGWAGRFDRAIALATCGSGVVVGYYVLRNLLE